LKKILLFLFMLLFSIKIAFASLGDFTISDEAKLGKKFYAWMCGHFPVVYDPYIVNYVERIAEKIKSILPPQPFDITINIIHNDEINAFAGPGGHVFVNTGLILIMDNEAELAAVLCHEFAHVTQRHLARNIKRQRILTVGSLVGLLAGALIGESLGQAMVVGSVAGVQSAMLKYTREEEREADQIGIEYLSRAGFPPSAMVQAFLKLKQQKILSGDNNIPSYFMTHPGIEERISYLMNMLKSDSSQKEKPQDSEFEKVKTLIIAHYTAPDRGLEMAQASLSSKCERKIAMAILFSRKNEVKKAQGLFADDSCGESLPFWFREKGRFYFELGRIQDALKYLNKALSVMRDDYYALFFMGRIYGSMGKVDLALADLNRVLEYVPHDSEVHYILGRIKGRYVGPFYGYLHFAYAALYRGDKAETLKFYNRAKKLASSGKEKRLLRDFEKEYKVWKEYW